MNSFKKVKNAQVIDTVWVKATQVLILVGVAIFLSHGMAFSAEKAVVFLHPPAMSQHQANTQKKW